VALAGGKRTYRREPNPVDLWSNDLEATEPATPGTQIVFYRSNLGSDGAHFANR
jgi:hypothetical protein